MFPVNSALDVETSPTNAAQKAFVDGDSRNGSDLASDLYNEANGMGRSSTIRQVTVKNSDTLTKLAGTNDPDTLDRIAQYNGLRSRHEIRAGQNLQIPDDGILSSVDVSRTIAARGTAGAEYYAQRQAEMAAAKVQAQEEPAWSFREASMAQRKADDAQAAREFERITGLRATSKTDELINGTIGPAPARSYTGDIAAIWNKDYLPLGQRSGQSLMRTFVPSQYEYEFMGGYRQEDSWKLRLAGATEFLGGVAGGGFLATGKLAQTGALGFFEMKNKDALFGGGFSAAFDVKSQFDNNPDLSLTNYKYSQTFVAGLTSAVSGYLGSGKQFWGAAGYAAGGSMLNTAYGNWLNDKNDSLAFSAATAVLGTGLGTAVGSYANVPLSKAFSNLGNYSYMKAANYGYSTGSFVNNGSSSLVGYGANRLLFGDQ